MAYRGPTVFAKSSFWILFINYSPFAKKASQKVWKMFYFVDEINSRSLSNFRQRWKLFLSISKLHNNKKEFLFTILQSPYHSSFFTSKMMPKFPQRLSLSGNFLWLQNTVLQTWVARIWRKKSPNFRKLQKAYIKIVLKTQNT